MRGDLFILALYFNCWKLFNGFTLEYVHVHTVHNIVLAFVLIFSVFNLILKVKYSLVFVHLLAFIYILTIIYD